MIRNGFECIYIVKTFNNMFILSHSYIFGNGALNLYFNKIK